MCDEDWADACMKPAQRRAIITVFNATKGELKRRAQERAYERTQESAQRERELKKESSRKRAQEGT